MILGAMSSSAFKCLNLQFGRVLIKVNKLTGVKCPCYPDAGPRLPAEHLREVFYRMGLDDKVWDDARNLKKKNMSACVLLIT